MLTAFIEYLLNALRHLTERQNETDCNGGEYGDRLSVMEEIVETDCDFQGLNRRLRSSSW